MNASGQSLAADRTPCVKPHERPRVGFIVGPTGAGKSALAMEIAERLGAEIVNADARQIYRGMDIGTAKPSREDRAKVPHHLIDVRSPADPIDVAAFAALAREACREIAARGRAALVVGGSGLYLRALRGGIFSGPAASPEIRERLQRIAAEHGAGRLHDRLREIDPEAASRIGYGDLYRIVRALEVFELTGEPISAHQRRHAFSARDFDCLTAGIATDRKQLYDAIDRRFDEMMAAGFTAEVRGLLAAGLRPDRAPLSSIGYKHIAAHLAGEVTEAAAIALAKRDSRRLAKRQLTWFRHDPEIVWLDPSRPAEHALSLFSDFFAAGRAGVAA
ncbi:MAG TPA: tRNA (adenosine(37)-N6)-dimethylallyltransferase MiaA [Candidatus Binataceae bacterium]|nr:tRNA (adenosine(37)-N6)-dimethylallyltransferase MiaA [Candidatus Binataceae bacterium]